MSHSNLLDRIQNVLEWQHDRGVKFDGPEICTLGIVSNVIGGFLTLVNPLIGIPATFVGNHITYNSGQHYGDHQGRSSQRKVTGALAVTAAAAFSSVVTVSSAMSIRDLSRNIHTAPNIEEIYDPEVYEDIQAGFCATVGDGESVIDKYPLREELGLEPADGDNQRIRVDCDGGLPRLTDVFSEDRAETINASFCSEKIPGMHKGNIKHPVTDNPVQFAISCPA